MKFFCAIPLAFVTALSASAIPLYESFDYDISAGGTATNLIGKTDTRDSIAWFLAGPKSTNQAPLRLVTKLSTNTAAAGFIVGFSKNGSSESQFTYATNIFQAGDIVFVAAAFTFINDSADANDYARLWVNPDPSTFGAAVPPDP